VTQKHTVSMAFVRAAVRNLDLEVTRRVLARAGIPAELLGVPAARVSAKAFAALWLTVAHELDDEFFGLDSRRMKVGSFALLSSALVQAPSVEAAVRRMLRGFSVFLDDIEGELCREGTQAVIRIHNRIRDPESRRFAEETYLVMVHGLMCWLAGVRIPLLRTAFAYPRPEHADEYRAMFAPEMQFDAERTAVCFDASILRAPTVQNPESLRRFLRSAPQSVFLKYKNEESWTARLRARLRATQGQAWPTLEEVAAELDIAPATLRRRLRSERTSYQAIKDHLRRDIAIHQLIHEPVSVSEIATAVGFQDTSAFHRAFRRWTGSQPGEYRLRQRRVP
jgi:AraC-like DNA-binding protein